MKKTSISIVTIAIMVAAIAFAGSVSANATVKSGFGPNASSTQKRVSKLDQTAERLQARADKEIDRRSAALNKLQTKIQNMKRVSATTKSAFASNVQAQINLLNNLKIKINAETDAETLKGDVQSITKAYRIYALIMPQTEIVAAAEKLVSTADAVSAYVNKLQARLETAKNEGKDVVALQVLLNGMNAKISDAKDQAAKATAGVTGLVPDNGDKDAQTANLAALKAARANIKAGIQDIKDANKAGLSIRAGLKDFAKADKKTNATSTATTTVE